MTRGRRPWTGKVQVICTQCGTTFNRYPSAVARRNFCNRICKRDWHRTHAIGVDAPHFKGGTSITRGYIRVYAPWAPCADGQGYALLHRLIKELLIGRPLREDEEVHHRDGNKANCHPDNLELLTGPEHAAEHWRMRP